VNTTVDALAALVGGQVVGESPERPITGVASLADAVEGQIAFFANPKYGAALRTCKASAVLVPLDFEGETAAVKIKVANPSLAFAQVLESFTPPPIAFPPGVHPSAVIAADAVLGEGVSIQPFAVVEPGARIGRGCFLGAHSYVGHGVTLGEDCTIHPNVTLREGSILGNRVVLHSGAVVGSDGFGYETLDGRHIKIPQTGIVQIDDDVEIGANTTIDRARFGKTWIQEGTKIDNLVQIAHNVVIGKHSIIVSQAGISGSSRLGQYVTLAGQVGLVGHIEVGDFAVVAAQSGVSKNVPSKEVWFGYPATPLSEQKERLANINRLPKLFARVKLLEERYAAEGKDGTG
jgi:UDP-3-O-[3-hydroxymyristoyl] glucosamine N-acyltransferase